MMQVDGYYACERCPILHVTSVGATVCDHEADEQ